MRYFFTWDTINVWVEGKSWDVLFYDSKSLQDGKEHIKDNVFYQFEKYWEVFEGFKGGSHFYCVEIAILKESFSNAKKD